MQCKFMSRRAGGAWQLLSEVTVFVRLVTNRDFLQSDFLIRYLFNCERCISRVTVEVC